MYFVYRYLEMSNDQLKKRTLANTLKLNQTVLKSMFPRLNLLHKISNRDQDGDMKSGHIVSEAEPGKPKGCYFIDAHKLRAQSDMKHRKFMDTNAKLYKIYNSVGM